jgi:predicted CopG family antitoxin
MSSKVKCTCGWSWNKSDSSKKDMYICHECGRDNSNNMKNGGWLDNYGEEENANESSVSLPDGYVGMGNDTQGRNSSPAWGGQFQDGGELLQSKESTSVNKKPFNKKELKNIIKDETERTRTGYVKNYRAEANKIEKFLPTKETVEFFNKIKKDAGPELFTALLNIQNKQGNPSVNIGTNKGLPFHNRKNYNPFTNEVNIPNSPEILDDIYNYLSEVSHANQSLSEVIPKFLKNDIPGYLKAFTSRGETSENVQKYVYDNPNTVENYTHQKIEPSLINQIENYDYSNHWPISKEEESREYNLIENKLKGGNKNLQMGGSIPGAVGFSYARTNSPAPSKGKYAKKTMASAKNGRWLDSYEDGGVIKDDRGQWDHPGEITEIGSNDITMEGVPYDVLGISDTGDTKLMKPGKNYKFKGKKVTEYPMAKNGLRQEQKGLQNLDNLTNFTNYNTKQPGGWLDNL